MKKTRFLAALLAVALVLVLLPAGGFKASAADTTETVDLKVTFLQSSCREETDMINAFRTGEDAWYWNSDDTTKTECSGLGTLEWDYNLELVAMQRAVEVAVCYSPAHYRTDGTRCYSAYSEAGYSYTAAGENIAAGYTTAESVFKAWREDDCSYSGQGHRRNMLSGSYTRFAAAGVYYDGTYYWVQEFAKSTSASSATTANDSLTTATVSLLLSKLESCALSVVPDAVLLKLGESSEVPAVTAAAVVAGHFNAYKGSNASEITLYPHMVLSVDDASVVSVSGTTLTALKAGNATVTMTGLGETVEIPVTVVAEDHVHSYEETMRQEATCAENGYVEYTCSCGYSYKEEIAATGEHNYAAVVRQEPTCTEHGWYQNVCTVCGAAEDSYWHYMTTMKNLQPLGHDYTESGRQEATCCADGYIEYTCSRCSSSYQDVITATGNHSYVPSAPSASGTVTWTCSGCSGSYTALPGDVDCSGSLDSADIALLARGISAMTEQGVRNADCNCDGTVDNRDLLVLVRHVAVE